jgi:hypothetical protein
VSGRSSASKPPRSERMDQRWTLVREEIIAGSEEREKGSRL